MNRVLSFIRNNRNIRLFLPESFEWLLLISDIIKNNETEAVIENPSEYIESSEFFSWERFFTRLLTDTTQGTYLQYSKSRINPNYLQKNIQNKVVEAMKGIEL